MMPTRVPDSFRERDHAWSSGPQPLTRSFVSGSRKLLGGFGIETDVGSSSRSALAPFAIAMAIPTFCRIPFEYVLTRRSADPSEGRPGETAPGVGRACSRVGRRARRSTRDSRGPSDCDTASRSRGCSREPLRLERLAVTSRPLIAAFPEVGSMKLRKRLIVVVLPAPFAPSRQNTSPGRLPGRANRGRRSRCIAW